MANNGVTMTVSYHTFKDYKEDTDASEIKIQFRRLASRSSIAKLASDLVALNVSFTHDANNGYGNEKGPEIRMGWGCPPAREVVEMLTAHGFIVKRDFTVYDKHKDVTAAVKLGTYDPDAPEPEAVTTEAQA